MEQRHVRRLARNDGRALTSIAAELVVVELVTPVRFELRGRARHCRGHAAEFGIEIAATLSEPPKFRQLPSNIAGKPPSGALRDGPATPTPPPRSMSRATAPGRGRWRDPDRATETTARSSWPTADRRCRRRRRLLVQ